MNDYFWMREAYALALKAKSEDEVPVGAVLVDARNQRLSQGWNQMRQRLDPCAHAECIVLQDAAKKIRNIRLLHTTLYVTLEPCAMCAGALIHARIERLVFATRDFRAGAAGSVCNLLSGSCLNHRIQIDEGMMQQECAELLRDFFIHKRN